MQNSKSSREDSSLGFGYMGIPLKLSKVNENTSSIIMDRNEITKDMDLNLDVRDESLANIEVIVLSIVLFVAIVGNSLILLALRRLLKFRPMSRMYFFMFNLSVADLLVAFGNILPQLSWDITYRFMGNDLLCRLVKYCQVFVLYLSTYVLTFMAVDRYLVVCHHSFVRNHYTIRGLKGPKIFILLSWILSFLFAIPQVFIFSMKEVKVDIFDCWATFIESWGEKAYILWFVNATFISPLLIIGASYGAICCKVVSFNIPPANEQKVKQKKQGQTNIYRKAYSFSSSSGKQTESESNPDCGSSKELKYRQSLKHQISQAKIKSIKLTLIVVLCFIVCWTPFCVTQLIMVFGPPITIPVEPAKVIMLLLPSLNSCTNPWIYLAFSETLSNQLRRFLGFGLGRGSDDASIGDEQEENHLRERKVVCKIVIEQADQICEQAGLHGATQSREDSPNIRIQIETKSEVI